MKTLFHPFFSRSAPSDGPAQEKMPGRQRTTGRRGPDKSAQSPSQPAATTTQRGTAFSSQPQRPPKSQSSQSQSQMQTHMQTPDATAEQQYHGLLNRIIRRGTTSRNGAANRGGSGGPGKNRIDATAARRQLTAVPDEEGYDGGGHAVPSCSGVAPLDHHETAQAQDDNGNASSSPAAQKTHRRFSRLQTPTNITNATTNVNTNMSADGTAKLRPRSSFRDRFWTASSANDFGDNAEPVTSPKSPTFKLSSQDASIPEEEPAAPTKPKAYVPRHAAADFSRTTVSSPPPHRRHHHHNHHRQSASWDGSRNSMCVPPVPQPAPAAPGANPSSSNYALDPRAVAEAETEAEADDPFADSNEADGGPSERDSLRRKRLSAPPAMHRRDSAGHDDDWPPSDYERFLEQARADERAQRIQAARRSWREGSKRDSAYYSGGRKGSARTSEDGSRRPSGSGRASVVPPVPVPMPPVALSGSAMADAKRQSRVAQKIVEYIRPPREDARMTALREA